jgi:hypothetical protein
MFYTAVKQFISPTYRDELKISLSETFIGSLCSLIELYIGYDFVYRNFPKFTEYWLFYTTVIGCWTYFLKLMQYFYFQWRCGFRQHKLIVRIIPGPRSADFWLYTICLTFDITPVPRPIDVGVTGERESLIDNAESCLTQLGYVPYHLAAGPEGPGEQVGYYLDDVNRNIRMDPIKPCHAFVISFAAHFLDLDRIGWFGRPIAIINPHPGSSHRLNPLGMSRFVVHDGKLYLHTRNARSREYLHPFLNVHENRYYLLGGFAYAVQHICRTKNAEMFILMPRAFLSWLFPLVDGGELNPSASYPFVRHYHGPKPLSFIHPDEHTCICLRGPEFNQLYRGRNEITAEMAERALCKTEKDGYDVLKYSELKGLSTILRSATSFHFEFNIQEPVELVEVVEKTPHPDQHLVLSVKPNDVAPGNVFFGPKTNQPVACIGRSKRNIAWAIAERYIKTQLRLQPDPSVFWKYYTRALLYGRMLRRYIGNMKYVIDGSTKKRMKQMEDYHTMKSLPFLAKAFVKGELYTKINHPRLIVNVHPAINEALRPWTDVMKPHQDHLLYMIGNKDYARITTLLQYGDIGRNDGSYTLQVLYLCATIIGEAMDYSVANFFLLMAITPCEIPLEERTLGNHKGMRDLMVLYLWVLYKSGAQTTGDVNTEMHGFIKFCARLEFFEPKAAFENIAPGYSDDQTCEVLIFKRYQEISRELGFVLNAEEPHELGYPRYCGLIWDDGVWAWDPKRVVPTLTSAIGSYSRTVVYSNKWFGFYRKEGRVCPILSTLAKWGAEHGASPALSEEINKTSYTLEASGTPMPYQKQLKIWEHDFPSVNFEHTETQLASAKDVDEVLTILSETFKLECGTISDAKAQHYLSFGQSEIYCEVPEVDLTPAMIARIKSCRADWTLLFPMVAVCVEAQLPKFISSTRDFCREYPELKLKADWPRLRGISQSTQTNVTKWIQNLKLAKVTDDAKLVGPLVDLELKRTHHLRSCFLLQKSALFKCNPTLLDLTKTRLNASLLPILTARSLLMSQWSRLSLALLAPGLPVSLPSLSLCIEMEIALTSEQLSGQDLFPADQTHETSSGSKSKTSLETFLVTNFNLIAPPSERISSRLPMIMQDKCMVNVATMFSSGTEQPTQQERSQTSSTERALTSPPPKASPSEQTSAIKESLKQTISKLTAQLLEGSLTTSTSQLVTLLELAHSKWLSKPCSTSKLLFAQTGGLVLLSRGKWVSHKKHSDGFFISSRTTTKDTHSWLLLARCSKELQSPLAFSEKRLTSLIGSMLQLDKSSFVHWNTSRFMPPSAEKILDGLIQVWKIRSDTQLPSALLPFLRLGKNQKENTHKNRKTQPKTNPNKQSEKMKTHTHTHTNKQRRKPGKRD